MDGFEEFSVLLSELAEKARVCGLSDGELRLLIGSWPLSPRPSREHETQARRLYELLGLVRWLLFEDAAEWLRRPHHVFHGRSPLALMASDQRMISVLRDRLRDEVDAA